MARPHKEECRIKKIGIPLTEKEYDKLLSMAGECPLAIWCRLKLMEVK